MVRPTRPKDMKPKAEGESGGSTGFNANKLIIVNTITTVLVCLLFIGANYLIQDKLLSTKLSHISAGDSENTAAEEEESSAPGLILDLGEFILNLNDVKVRRYLKVNVALELSRLDTDPNPHAAPSGGGGHGHGSEPVDPMKVIEQEMEQYKPAIRDAIISTLSSKTAEELSSIAGKDLAKEEIKESVDAIFAGHREVQRVSFGTFIIQ